jgi:hypothetical protein
VVSSDAEDWPIEVSHRYDDNFERHTWTIRYVSGNTIDVHGLDQLRKLIGETNFKAWSANG